MDNTLENTPFNPSAGEIIIKVFGGAFVGVILSFFIFIIYTFSSHIFQTAIENMESAVNFTTNPMIGIIVAIIAFIATFLGSLMLAGLYNVAFSNRYYDVSKMIVLSLIVNAILFLFSFLLYLLYTSNLKILFFILAFHVIFSLFVVLLIFDILSNPNYSVEYIVGNTGGFLIVLFLIALLFKLSGSSLNLVIFLFFPILIAYSIIPLVSNIWEKIYYKFYQMGNNFLYVPSLTEVIVDETEEEEVNVDV